MILKGLNLPIEKCHKSRKIMKKKKAFNISKAYWKF